MKAAIWFKRTGALGLVLILIALMVTPAAAQQPEGEGQVEAAQTVHAGFCLNPNSNSNGAVGPICPVGVAQTVPSSGVAATELTVADVDNLASVQIAIDYNKDVVRIKDIRPGSLFDGLTPGVDYVIDKSKIGGYAAPLDPVNEPAIPAPGGCGTATGVCWRSYIYITVYNWATPKVPLGGTGSLIRIYWQVQPVAAGSTSIVTFPILSMANKSGSSIWPCLPDTLPLPNVYCKPVPTPLLVANQAPVANLIVGSPTTAGLQFQVALEGGKVPGDDDPNNNFPTPGFVTDVSVVAGVFADVADAAGVVSLPFAAAYPMVTVSRPGYLSARATNVLPGTDLGLVTLLAGDVTGDNNINIFDLTVVAGSLGAPVGTSTALEMMDFNADGVVTIADLALLAKNYGLSGPRPFGPIP
ncbi:MAG: dockerin type I domain-containing protein [Anaerolineae bacterium]|nr:dockerin type I domain-containing protein [Anaerolineae bacterium]MDW8069887.1 dockerin type I domain-containing protein [Anaerolineae bacterium]